MEKLVPLSLICPQCNESIMTRKKLINGLPSIELDIKYKGEIGKLYLCASYGCFKHKSSIRIEDNDTVEISCPRCKQTMETGIGCEDCNAPLITCGIRSGGRVCFCSRKGCQKHFVAFENLDDAIRKFHEEFTDYAADL